MSGPESLKKFQPCSPEDATQMRLPGSSVGWNPTLVGEYEEEAERRGWRIEEEGEDVVVSGGTNPFDGTRRFFQFGGQEAAIFEMEI
jgi:hypothetical protein